MGHIFCNVLISCKLYYVNRDQAFILSSCSTKEFLFSRMPHQPSVTGTESRNGVLHSRVADDGRHWQAPDVTTLTTPPSPKPPVTRTSANDISDAIITSDDPEFGNKVWAYIRSQLLRLQGTNVQWTARRMRLLDAFTLKIITTATTITISIIIHKFLSI